MKDDGLELIKPSDSQELEVSSDNHEEALSKVKKTLENYFSSFDSLIGKSSEEVNKQGQLDYFLSRRFLLTAYNNLKNFDPSMHDHKDITEKLKVIQQLHRAYYNTGEKVNVPQLAFEMIFLRAQPEYVQYISDKEKYTSRISVLITAEQSLSSKISDKASQLKELSKNDKRQAEFQNDLKHLRGNYVDAVDEKATLDEKLAELTDIKFIYTEKYYGCFLAELSQLSKEYQKVIGKILNHKAYELDELIWKNAAKSKHIQAYFDESGIKGGYSTLTFLRYYLNTVDKQKLTDEHRELFKFLEYLENKNKA